MYNVASGAHKRFKSLLDAVEADRAGLGNNMTLGPCVGDDDIKIDFPGVTVLGPCVGDDDIKIDSPG
jgi:hypothetical protein